MNYGFSCVFGYFKPVIPIFINFYFDCVIPIWNLLYKEAITKWLFDLEMFK